MTAIDPDRLPHGSTKAQAVQEMFDAIAPRYDLLNRILTFGLDRRWRRKAVEELHLEPGAVVIDLACGTGDICRELERSHLRAIGLDFSAGMLSSARTTAPLVQADALALPLPDGSVDGATSGFGLRNFVALPPFFSEMARVLRPGGRFALLEVDEPHNSLLRWGHGVYFGRVVPALGGLISDRSAYRYLPRSVAYLPGTDALLSMLRHAGFVGIRRRALSGGISQIIVGTRDRT